MKPDSYHEKVARDRARHRWKCAEPWLSGFSIFTVFLLAGIVVYIARDQNNLARVT